MTKYAVHPMLFPARATEDILLMIGTQHCD